MKRCFILVLSIILLLASCNSELSEYEQSALVAKDFFEIIYDIDNYNQVKSEDDFYSFSIYHNKQLLSVSEYFTENGCICYFKSGPLFDNNQLNMGPLF